MLTDVVQVKADQVLLGLSGVVGWHLALSSFPCAGPPTPPAPGVSIRQAVQAGAPYGHRKTHTNGADGLCIAHSRLTRTNGQRDGLYGLEADAGPPEARRGDRTGD